MAIFSVPALPYSISIGLVQHIDLCVRKHLADGSPVRILNGRCPPFPGFYLYVPSRAQMPAKLRALMDFLIEQREQLARESRDAIQTGKRKGKTSALKGFSLCSTDSV